MTNCTYWDWTTSLTASVRRCPIHGTTFGLLERCPEESANG